MGCVHGRWRDPITLSFKNNFVGAMPNPVNRGRSKDAIGESFGPFGDIQIRCDDRAFAFVAFGDHIVEVFILDSFKGFQPEIIDNEQVDIGKFGALPFITVCCPGGVQLGQHPVGRGEQNVMSGADRRMSKCLGDVTLSRSTGSDNQDTDLFFDKTAGSQFSDECTVETGAECKIKFFDGFLTAETGSA